MIPNAIIAYVHTQNAEEGVRALQKVVVPKARVLREEKEKEMHSKRLVLGDIVLLASGSKVPAALLVYAFLHALRGGDSLEQARTVAVTTMVFFQFFPAWNSRSEVHSTFRISPLSNPFLFYALIAAFLAHLAVLYLPPLQ